MPSPGDAADRLLWIGEDDRGVLLQFIGVELSDRLLIIHVMPFAYRRNRWDPRRR